MNIKQKLEWIAKLDAKCGALRVQENNTRSKQRELEHEVALELCPFTEGQKVVDTIGGEQFFVGTIRFSSIRDYRPDGYSFKVRKIKKDGMPYIDEQGIWGSAPTDYEAVVEEEPED
tara:strand:+ start:145 stop:495 length:351 start_codon:yes stop_codon:yes gene_type:complete